MIGLFSYTITDSKNSNLQFENFQVNDLAVRLRKNGVE